MEANPKRLRFVITALYSVFFAVYIFIGLQPVDAKNYEISGQITIPEISLNSDVTTLQLEGKQLSTPERIVGAYSNNENKTLLIAHSTSAFRNLNRVSIGSEIYYNEETYVVSDINTYEKQAIRMSELLKAEEEKTLVLMTCAGTPVGDQDATHRLIVTSTLKK